ncbi:Protein of unknown function [Leuconostoc citreum]|nr:Protein of unknown function [Leuconostoc citreum]
MTLKIEAQQEASSRSVAFLFGRFEKNY